MTATPLRSALAALRRHPTWYLFPIKAGAKYPPLIADNLDRASNDPKQIESWGAAHPGCNWGLSLAKSRTVVLDVDMLGEVSGIATLDMLEVEHGALPPTYRVTTPRGGFHFYFEEANGVQHACRLGVHGFGLKVDCPNYVVMAGGRTANGRYSALDPAMKIADAPAWFAQYLRPSNQDTPEQQAPSEIEPDLPGNVKHAIEYLKRDAPPAIQGANGEHTLLMVAAALKDMGISQDRSIDLLLEFYNGRCDPPWSAFDGPVADRLDVKVKNAWLYLKQNAPGAHTAAADFGAEPEPEVWDPPQVHPSAVEARREWERNRNTVELDGVSIRVRREKQWS